MTRGKPTRRERVLEYLQQRPNTWVPGLELMNAEVGGLRAGARLYELRLEGHDIIRRPDPASAVHQYMLRLSDEQFMRRVGAEQLGLFAEVA